MHTLTPVDLRCEYLKDPPGIDASCPRFSWILESSKRGEYQTAYQIIIASSRENLDKNDGDKWDSGKVESDDSVNIAYEENNLKSGEAYCWKVRAWDKDDSPGAWSDVASFGMGLLNEDDWKGKWIGTQDEVSSPLFRKEFTVDKEIKQARVYISGLGYYELYINGQKVGDHVLDPGTTYYTNVLPFELQPRVLYVTYDVTDLLNDGHNAVGVILGHGWWSSDGESAGRQPYSDKPILMMQMNVEFSDGTELSIATSETWKTASSPVIANDFATGEYYDARLEQPGWNVPAFDDSDWNEAVPATPPDGKLSAQMMEPIKVMQKVKPVRILKSGDDSYIFDMGQFISGWVELRVKGARGSEIKLRHAGRVNYNTSSLDCRNNDAFQSAQQADKYILKGDGIEVWQPRFTLHGFRYVEVTGCPNEPTLDDVEGQVVYSSVETMGEFSCSNSLINQIHQNVCWTFMGSFQSIPQDAADRAERVGWLGDPGFVAEDYIYNFGTASFWTKWMNDIKDSQKSDGCVPYVSPPNWGANSYNMWPAWQSAYHLFVWYVYQYYDDKRILAEHYDSMKKLVDFFSSHADNYIMPDNLGDHMEPQGDGTSSFSPNRTPNILCATAYYYYTAWIVAQTAEILGKTDDAERYVALTEDVKKAFNEKFLDTESNQYATGSQTSNALPLYLGMVPKGREAAVAKNVVDDIVEKHNGHLSTGIIGTNALEQILSEYGYAEVMYTIMTQTTFPGWGHGVINGATTIWEDFEGSYKRSVSMKMFGSTELFLYRDLAGISPTSPGYKQLTIKPHIVDDLEDVSAWVKTVRGLVSSSWSKDGNGLRLNVTIPVNSQAEVSVPKMGVEKIAIKESGKIVWENGSYVKNAAGITDGNESAEYVVFSLGSGSYSFEL